MKHALLILTLIFSIQSQAIGLCDNPSQLQTLWESKYKTIIKSDFDSFHEGSQSYMLAQTICFIDNAQLPNLDFFTYFTKALSSFFIRSTSGQNPPLAQTNYAQNVIDIFAPFFKNFLP